MTPVLARRLLLAVPLAGCIPPEPPRESQPAPATPPPPELASLAALATVRLFDPETRHAVLELAGGSVIDMTAAPGARNLGALRAGARVVVEYDAAGTVRLLPAGRLDRAGRTRATVREVEIGGRSLMLADTAGVTQDFALNHPAMMAFATRLRAGDEVAVSVAGP